MIDHHARETMPRAARKTVTAGQESPQWHFRGPRCIHRSFKQRRRKETDGYPLSAQPAHHAGRLHPELIVDDTDRRSSGQVRPHLPASRIECWSRQSAWPDPPASRNRFPGAADEVDHASVLDHHALGLAGRARGVDDVGQVVRPGGGWRVAGGLAGDGRPVGVEADHLGVVGG